MEMGMLVCLDTHGQQRAALHFRAVAWAPRNNGEQMGKFTQVQDQSRKEPAGNTSDQASFHSNRVRGNKGLFRQREAKRGRVGKRVPRAEKGFCTYFA